jgi:23S rRNA pseudouridine1911/1915/1917 synthase
MKKLKIVYEDKNILVIDKEPHLLTIATAKERERTLYHEASEYVKKQYPKNKVFIVHRLDKETSGLVLFAKSKEIQEQIQTNWNNSKREYIAIVEGTLENKEQELRDYLYETKSLDVYVTKDPKKGKIAITKYRVLKENNKYSLLEINIKTGRRNQIRAQLDNIKHPIIGDKKYHSKTNPLKRLGLHASKLELKLNNKEYTFEAKTPNEFNKLF